MRINKEAVTPELPAILGAGALAAAALALSFLAASMAGNHRTPTFVPSSVRVQPAAAALSPTSEAIAHSGPRLGGL